ncbi:MAG TPA: transglycosylase SLT domain-containing protein [Vicinamibacterales bacterium]|nr:transglycosylase SLT domain-containing protein [Vicinamibacterales bacterium]
MIRRVLLSAALMAMAPAVAQAQIYAWRDSAGNLVLSDKPKDPSAKTYEVAAAAPTFRATRAAVRERSAAYEDLILEHATRHEIDPNLVRAVIQAESGFDPLARSPKGAMGLMQLMPETAAEYGVDNAYDPAANIGAGVAYLKSLLVRYDGDESLALAAYNAGPGAVKKYGNTVPPYRETREYVARVRGTAGIRPATRIFKIVEVVDGHEVVRYSNKPAPGATRVRVHIKQ